MSKVYETKVHSGWMRSVKGSPMSTWKSIVQGIQKTCIPSKDGVDRFEVGVLHGHIGKAWQMLNVMEVEGRGVVPWSLFATDR
eukprot:scaffold2636_cov340-Pavlova_lutheri.AAC.6